MKKTILTLKELESVTGGEVKEITTEGAIYGTLAIIGAAAFCYYVIDPLINIFFKNTGLNELFNDDLKSR